MPLPITLDVLVEANSATGLVIGGSMLSPPECPHDVETHCQRCTGPVRISAHAQRVVQAEPRTLVVCCGCAIQWSTRREA